MSFIDKVPTGTQSLALFIWNVAPVLCIAVTPGTGGFTSGRAAILGVIDISDIIHSFDHDQLSSISQIIKGKLINLQNSLINFKGTTTCISNALLSFGCSLLFPSLFLFASSLSS